jgi:hypothetical protein
MKNEIFTEDQISHYRKKFFQKLKKRSNQWELKEIDLSWAIYAQNTIKNQVDTVIAEEEIPGITVVEDQFWMARTGFSPMQLIYHLEEQWWKKRKILNQSEAGIGFYGRYLSGVGYFCVMSFKDNGYFTMHRYDPQGKEDLLLYPKDEGLFYDQFGTFLDYRTGWKWMIQTFKKTKEPIVREVELGLSFGIRKGEPNTNPADREDDQLEELFSKHDIDRFDTLEFIGSEEAQTYPFEEGTFEDWLDQSQVATVKSREVDLFVLANSEAFVDAVRDLAEMKQVEVNLSYAQKEGQDDVIVLYKKNLKLEKSFSYAYLWTLHTAQSYHQSASAMLSEFIEQVDEAEKFYHEIEQELGAYFSLKQEQELLTLKSKKTQKSKSFPIFEWCTLGVFEGVKRVDLLKKFLGIGEQGEWIEVKHSLKQCPICGDFATIQAMIRAKNIELKHQKHFFDIGPVKGYFALICPKHQVPIDWEKQEEIKKQYHEQPLQQLQIRGSKTFTATEHPELKDVKLLWGPELAGAFTHHSSRDLLLDLNYTGYAYAYTPNIVAIFPQIPDQHINLLKNIIQRELPALEYHNKSHAPLDWFIGKLERKEEL